MLQRRLSRPDGGELEHVIVGRLLQVAQGFVNRKLGDEGGLGVAVWRYWGTFRIARVSGSFSQLVGRGRRNSSQSRGVSDSASASRNSSRRIRASR